MDNAGVLLSVSRYLKVVHDIDLVIDDARTLWQFRSYVTLLDDVTLLEYWEMYKETAHHENDLVTMADIESLEKASQAELTANWDGLLSGLDDAAPISTHIDRPRQDFSLYQPMPAHTATVNQDDSMSNIVQQINVEQVTTKHTMDETEQRQAMKIRLPTVI